MFDVEEFNLEFWMLTEDLLGNWGYFDAGNWRVVLAAADFYTTGKLSAFFSLSYSVLLSPHGLRGRV